jgi:hypothetical protein
VQLSTFLFWSGAIETAFQETQAVAGTMDVQQGERFVIPTWEYNMLMGRDRRSASTLALRYLARTWRCKGRSAIAISNLNTPPAAYQ